MSILNNIHGCYRVGDQLFVNKPQALQYATETKQDITWYFHDDVYSKFDWRQRPKGTLPELYRERAQQLRDRYDYITLHFSGGQDSWTMLHSFFSNNIHVDEVLFRWAFAERKYKAADATNLNETNIGSEYEYAVLPVLEHIKKTYPRTKITILDYSKQFQVPLQEEAVLRMNRYQNMGTFVKFVTRTENDLANERHLTNSCIVLGCDKIDYEWSGGEFYAYFSDTINLDSLDPDRTAEFFYWTPDYPTIPILQAHCLKEYLLEYQHTGLEDISRANKYRRLYSNACYPDYNPDTFQVDKQVGTLIYKSEDWIYHYNPEFVKSWRWNLKQYFESISPEYLVKSRNSNITLGVKKVFGKKYLV